VGGGCGKKGVRQMNDQTELERLEAALAEEAWAAAKKELENERP